MNSINLKKEILGPLDEAIDPATTTLQGNRLVSNQVLEWSPAELYAQRNSCEMIDVRSPEEFNGPLSHVVGSKLITLGSELDKYLKEKSEEKQIVPIVFICRSGARSMKAALQGIELGIKQVVNLKGGMIDWNEVKLPIHQSGSGAENL